MFLPLGSICRLFFFAGVSPSSVNVYTIQPPVISGAFACYARTCRRSWRCASPRWWYDTHRRQRRSTRVAVFSVPSFSGRICRHARRAFCSRRQSHLHAVCCSIFSRTAGRAVRSCVSPGQNQSTAVLRAVLPVCLHHFFPLPSLFLPSGKPCARLHLAALRLWRAWRTARLWCDKKAHV